MSPDAAKFLTSELLGRLESVLQERDPALVARLAPGLTDAEIDEATTSLGLTLPYEARIWWRWHDGVHSSTVADRLFGAGLHFMSLAEAIRTYRSYTEIWSGSPEIRSSNWWAPKLFPLIERGSGTLNCDCSVAGGWPSPVRFAGHGVGDEMGQAASLGDVVQWWIDALEGGGWYFDQVRGGWDADYSRVPSERRVTGLV